MQRGKCEKTLMHSLRIKSAQTKDLEWQDELAGENLIWLGGKVQKLSEFNGDDKLELLYSIAPKPPVRYKRKHQSNRRKYKSKVKKAIRSEARKGHKEAADFMASILDYDDEKFISYAKLEQFKALKMTRKNQRIKMLETYLESHNLLCNSPANENALYLQEGLFKIPHQWGIGTDIIPKESYITAVRDFLSKYFTDYPIEMIVCHHDERSLEEDTGAHSHYFLSGRSSKTGRYDLHKTQIKVVNKYIKQHGDIDDRLPENAQLNRIQAQVFGEYFQRMFYDYVNQNLLTTKGIVAEFAPETERQSQERKMINRESKLPKRKRSYNMKSREAEVAQSRLDELLAYQQAEESKLNVLRVNITSEQEQLKIELAKIKEANELLRYFSSQAQLKSDELKAVEAELDRLSYYSERLNNQAIDAVVNICKDLYVRTANLGLGLDRKAEKYAVDILENYKLLLSPAGRAICEVAAQALKDDLLDIANSGGSQLEQEIKVD